MNTPSEHDLHAYVDGHLDPPQRRAVEDWLATHPDRAAEIRAWQRDAQQLRAALGAAAEVPAGLDPTRLRQRLRTRRRGRLAIAATLVLGLGAGGLGGWQLRAWRSTEPPPMADALQAYRMFAADGAFRPDVGAATPAALQQWLRRNLAHAPALPDLAAAGFRPVGGRLLATAEGPAAMVLYRDGRGAAISFYVRPPAAHRRLPRGERRDGALLAQYGSADGYYYAVVSRADGREARVARTAVPDAG